jgi:hypothetical protein
MRLYASRAAAFSAASEELGLGEGECDELAADGVVDDLELSPEPPPPQAARPTAQQLMSATRLARFRTRTLEVFRIRVRVTMSPRTAWCERGPC